MKRSYVVIGIVIVLVAGVVGYLLLVPGASDFLAETQIIEDQAQIDEMALAYIAQPYPDDYNTTRIPGYLDNRSESEFAEVTIEIQLLTDDGDAAELIQHELTDIAPGARKTFDINAGTIGETRRAEVDVTSITIVVP